MIVAPRFSVMISNLFKSIIIKCEYFHIFMNVASILIIHGIYGDCYALSIVPMERQFIIPDSVHRGTEIEDTVFSHELDEIVFTQKKKGILKTMGVENNTRYL